MMFSKKKRLKITRKSWMLIFLAALIAVTRTFLLQKQDKNYRQRSCAKGLTTKLYAPNETAIYEKRECEVNLQCGGNNVCRKEQNSKLGSCHLVAQYGDYCNPEIGPLCIVGECVFNKCEVRKMKNKSFKINKEKYRFTTFWCTNEKYSDYPNITRSCEFRNLYYYKNKWTLFLPSKQVLTESLDLWPWSKHSKPYPFQIRYIDDEFVSEYKNIVFRKGLYLYFQQPWAYNVGHAIFDGLYAAWVAMLSVGRKNASDFTLIIDKPDTKSGRYQSDDIFEAFGNQNSYIKEHEMMRRDNIQIFETVVMGSGAKGQRWVTNDLRMAGANIGAPVSFRNKVYDYFDLRPRAWKRKSPEKVRAIIVKNKRYSLTEEKEILKVVAAAKKAGLSLKYIDWSQIGTHPNNLKHHLQIVKSIDIYISGPGTGMMYAPFLPDKSVFIGLGHWQTRENTSFVTYMEQNVLEACSFLKVLYYPSNMRASGINAQVLTALYEHALDLTTKGFSIPVAHGSNLSPEGNIFKTTCQLHPLDCQLVLEGMNDIRMPNFCVHYSWIEEVVYEVGTNSEAKPGVDTECIPWIFREELRRQLLKRRRTYHDISQPCRSESCFGGQVQSFL